MPRHFDPEGDRRFFLKFDSPRLTKFEPEKTGPFNRSHYLAMRLNNFVRGYLLGLGEQVLPMARSMAAWMAAQTEPSEGKDVEECFRAKDWWVTQGLCKWLIDGDPAEAEFAKASDAYWQIWDRFLRIESDGAEILRSEGLELALPLNLAARRPDIGLHLCRVAGLTAKPSSAPAIVRAELMYGQWACRHLAEGGKPDAAYVAKGEEMLRQIMMERLVGGNDYTKMALWLKAIYHDSGVTRTPEETIFKAYDTMTGAERPAFVRS